MGVLDFFGVEAASPARRARDHGGAARRVRRDGAVRAQLHQGPALDGRHFLRPQAHPHRREGQSLDGRLPRGPRRCGAAGAAARAGGVPLAQPHVDPAAHSAGVHEGRGGGHRRGGREREDRERRHVAARRVGAFPGHVRRADQGRYLPDAGRAPAGDSRHADRRGDQRRSPGVRAEDDRRGGARSEEDGRQHRHPDHPADQRRAGVSRCARQEADGRGQARCRHRRSPGDARRDDQVGDGRSGRQDQALRGGRGDCASRCATRSRGRRSSTRPFRRSRPRPSSPGRSRRPSPGRK